MTKLAAVRTPLDAEAVRAALTSAWTSQFGDEPASDSVTVLLAQIALETGLTSCVAFNVGNAKAAPGQDFCEFDTDEFIDGRRIHLTAGQPGTQFRAFATLDDGIAAYLPMMRRHFAHAWPAVLAGDPYQFAVLLKEANYYTAPVGAYAAGLVARFEMYALPSLNTQPQIASSLEALGYSVGAGEYAAAVKSFQTDRGLVADGIVGRKTKHAIRAALAAC